MKKLLKIVIISVAFAGAFCFSVFAREEIKDDLHSVEDGALVCPSSRIFLPSFWPYLEDVDKKALFYEGSCKSGESIYIGLVSGCRGRSVCSIATLSRQLLNDNISSQLEEALSKAKITKINLANKHTAAYYIPSSCRAYCSGARVIWFVNGAIHILTSSKSVDEESDIRQMKKTIESFLENNGE